MVMCILVFARHPRGSRCPWSSWRPRGKRRLLGKSCPRGKRRPWDRSHPRDRRLLQGTSFPRGKTPRDRMHPWGRSAHGVGDVYKVGVANGVGSAHWVGGTRGLEGAHVVEVTLGVGGTHGITWGRLLPQCRRRLQGRSHPRG